MVSGVLLIFGLPMRAVPHFGRLTDVLLEAVIMLIAMIVAARWVIQRFNVPQTFASTISMGLVALAILRPAEIAGVVWVWRLSLHEYLGSLVTVPGLVSPLMFLLFPAMPTLVMRASRSRLSEIS
jgi:hypothetical protein